MPIYEFYCADCHRLFNFFSRTVNTWKRPQCPHCGRPELERRMSSFAISKGRADRGQPQEDMPDIDESRMEKAMEELAREGEGMNEEDPRQMAKMMRRLCETSGLPLGEGMEQAIRRMEAGEDPEKIEEEMGDVFADEGPSLGEGGKSLRNLARRLRPPEVDQTIYDL